MKANFENFKLGTKEQSYDKDGYYVMSSCGTIIKYLGNGHCIIKTFDGNVYSTVQNLHKIFEVEALNYLNKGCDLVTHTNLNTMKNFNQVLDFLELQQQEDKQNTNQLHLIIQTLCTFLNKEQLQEVENLFNLFKK